MISNILEPEIYFMIKFLKGLMKRETPSERTIGKDNPGAQMPIMPSHG